MQEIVLLEKKNQFTIKDELVDTIIHDISGNVLFSCNGTKTFLQDRPGPSSPQTQGRPEEFFEAPRKAPDRSLNTALHRLPASDSIRCQNAWNLNISEARSPI